MPGRDRVPGWAETFEHLPDATSGSAQAAAKSQEPEVLSLSSVVYVVLVAGSRTSYTSLLRAGWRRPDLVVERPRAGGARPMPQTAQRSWQGRVFGVVCSRDVLRTVKTPV